MGLRDWVYLLSLLVPVTVYNLVLKGISVASQEDGGGLAGALSLMRSDLLFNFGYIMLWVGLFAAVRRGLLRWILTALFHAATVVVVIVTTSAYQYFKDTGSTLDYGVIVYYIATFGDIKQVVFGSTPFYVWIVLAVALLYVVAGPWLITRTMTRRDARYEPARFSRLASLGACVVAAVLCALSLVPAADVNKSFSLSPPVNVLATSIGGPNPADLTVRNAGTSVGASLKGASLEATPSTEKRNVVLIHLESAPHKVITPYNEDIQTTPYLDELAKQSLLVDRAYTTTPHTSKAITSVNCGVYPNPQTDITEAQPGGVPVPCLPELLDEQGYNSVFFQSATEKFEARPQLTENFGYQKFYGLQDMSTKGFQRAGYLGYEDDIMLEPSSRWLDEHGQDGPFMATYLGVTPHHEYLAPDRYGHRRFSDEDLHNRFLNAIRYDDFWVKNIIDQYKEKGLYDNTIFVIYGDHGEAFGEHGVKGHDGVIYEEGLRVPLIIHDPRNFQDGAEISGDTPVNHMDIVPTILDMLNYKISGGRYPGSSLFNLPANRTLYFTCRPDLVCMASMKGYEKFVYYYDKQPDEYYNLSRDPGERDNIASELNDRELEKLRSGVLKWRSRAADLYGVSMQDQ